MPSIPSVAGYAFASPNAGADASFARSSALRIASHLPADQPHLAFVNATAQAAFATLDRVAQVDTYVPSVTYPNNGFAQALRAVAGAIAKGIGTKVFWVQTGGYDTHAGQNTNAANGAYTATDGTLNDGLFAFYSDLQNQGLLSDTLVLQFSEFGRRITENGSNGTDHGAAGLMMAIGGSVRGGIYGTAARPEQHARQPDAREQRRRRAPRDRLPLGLRQGDRLLAGRGLDRDSRRETSGQRRRISCRALGVRIPRLQDPELQRTPQRPNPRERSEIP